MSAPPRTDRIHGNRASAFPAVGRRDGEVPRKRRPAASSPTGTDGDRDGAETFSAGGRRRLALDFLSTFRNGPLYGVLHFNFFLPPRIDGGTARLPFSANLFGRESLLPA